MQKPPPVPDPSRVLVVQTAFLGDVVLTLPLVQELKLAFPTAQIDVLTTPRCASLLRGHPSISRTLVFDKRGVDRGLRGLLRIASELRRWHYDVAIVPHRSLRSAMLVWLARIGRRIGFDRSAGRIVFTDIVQYDPSRHEVDRNLSLLAPLGKATDKRRYPRLYADPQDQSTVDTIFSSRGIDNTTRLVAIAPGTVWNTKRWLPERFLELAQRLAADDYRVFLIGGAEDRELCQSIVARAGSERVHSYAGDLTILQSAELIRRSRVLICNDSAPMHLALAVGTPVVAIFGATVPAFGFAPYGPQDRVVEITGLSCRPCSIHGGNRCPIETFECMRNISSTMVAAVADEVLGVSRHQ
jgi:heptosyltransferase-2